MAIPTRSGAEFQVNIDAAQATPDARVIALSGGRFLVVWGSRLQGDNTEGSEVRGQIYGANGLPVGSSFTLTSSPEGAQILPDIAVLANGQLAATWAEVGGLSADTSSWATRASILSATGVVQSMFDVNTTTFEGQYDGRITPLNDGGFVIAWQDHSAAVSDPTTTVDIRAQIFNADGSKRGSEFVVNASTSSAQMTPAITTLANGNFVVSWWDQGVRPDDGSSTSVRAQIYTPNGVKIGGEFLINTVTSGAQAFPALTPLANGGFFAAYADQSGTLGDPSGAVNGQFFSASGTPVGAAFRMNTETEGTQTLPDVAELPDGRIVAVWVDYTSTGGGFDRDIRAQVFNANGAPSGEEFLVNTSSAGIQEAPTVAALSDGRFVVTWTDDVITNDSAANVRAQIFDPRTGPTGPVNLVGTDAADTLTGGAFNDTISGGKGRDVLSGEGGNDVLSGANGNDTLYGGDGNDTVSGGNDHDRLYGGAGNDVVSGGKGNDVLWSGLGRDTLSGGVGSDDFVFLSAAEAGKGSNRDTISDFLAGTDDIDLSAFLSSNGHFIGSAAFSGTAGEVRYDQTTGVVWGDVNGDGAYDFQLMISNKAALTADDFIF